MRLILVHHGQTDFNKRNFYQGQSVNTTLNRVGVEQAEQIAERLKSESIDAIYSSDLDRALSTAKIIHATRRQKLDINITPGLRERNLGIYEGTLINPEKYVKDFKASGLSFKDFHPENGESWSALQKRIVAFFEKIIAIHTEHCVLLVSHGGTISMLILHLLDEELNHLNWMKYKVNNGSLSIFEWDEKFTKVITLNDTIHLV